MKKYLYIIIVLILYSYSLFSQEITGSVKQNHIHEGKQHLMPLFSANVYWLGTSIGVVTDNKGNFTIPVLKSDEQILVASFVGFKNDTIKLLPNQKEVHFVLNEIQEIDEVVISKRLGGQYVSKLDPFSTQTITEEGLLKLPCCNLAESFENNAAVDVSYSDAVTGIKQIQMLGLAGSYTQILRENMPAVRGLYSNYGLTHIPGSWMESIQISKGTSSVRNGFESTSGQINIEYKKPQNGDPLYVNLFSNHMGRAEANLTSAKQVSKNWSTMILAHGSSMANKVDANNDSFLDLPLNQQVNLMNRWKYINPETGTEAQLGIRYLNEQRKGGQVSFNEDIDKGSNSIYGLGINTSQYEAFGKFGFAIPNAVSSTIGTQFSILSHEQDAFFGLNNYTGEQNSIYGNIMFNTIIKHSGNNLVAGISFMYDDYNEQLNTNTFNTIEVVPGAFFEYTYTNPDKLSIIIGARADNHNTFGLFVTPRFHFKWNMAENTILRGSVGKGYRSPKVIAENAGLLASSRAWQFVETPELEEAWNYGVHMYHSIPMLEQREASISVDYYRTDFINQAIIDIDQDLNNIYIYNLDGKSYSNSFQSEFTIEPIKRFDVSMAYRLNDVKMTINGDLKSKPLVSRSKGLLTLSYATKFDKWKFDITNQLNGKSRLPDINGNIYRTETESPIHYILHAQVTKQFKHFSVYVGGENLTNFKQKNPIIASGDAFGRYFDTSIVWGPIFGRMFYGGIRINIKKKETNKH